MGVSINPGQTALIRIPLLAFSSAAVFVSPITPCLLALYAAAPSSTDQAGNRRHVYNSSAAALLEHLPNFVLQAEPDTFEIDLDGPIPVFFGLSDDGRPDTLDSGVIEGDIQAAKSLHRLLDERLNFGGFRTSVFTNRPSPPAARTSSTVSLPSRSRRPATTTLAPAFAKSTAVSRPMPDVPPVTSPTLPSNSVCHSFSFTNQTSQHRTAECRRYAEVSVKRVCSSTFNETVDECQVCFSAQLFRCLLVDLRTCAGALQPHSAYIESKENQMELQF